MFVLQRVKNPPIPLRDFSSIESMREEINEVVAFLQNPSAFQEMGARAPQVCYSQDITDFFFIIILSKLKLKQKYTSNMKHDALTQGKGKKDNVQ